MQDLVLSVSDCLALVNQTLDFAYPSVVVEGEVASFKISKDKYVFFDIKDSEGLLSCFMMIFQLHVPLEDGMKVQIVAQPRITAWGKFSLSVRDVKPVGEGSIKRSFQILKASLEKEGLFDVGRKRQLPVSPERVCLIASVESAGYADFVKILDQRWRGLDLTVADVQVQGQGAAAQIIGALNFFNEQADPAEVVVIVRGGGSADDLAVFNDERLVRAIAASRIPVLVGVGHEIDTSLADLAADVRAATPSNAAQLLVPDRLALQRELDQKLGRLTDRVEVGLKEVQQQVAQTADLLIAKMQQLVAGYNQRLGYAEATLRQLDPRAVLKRGYGIVRLDNDIVKKATHIKVGQQLNIEISDAIIQVGVTDVSKK